MTNEKNKNVGVIILAAGLSQRMKTPKPFLLFNKSQTFIEKIISNYQSFGCKNIVVVINKELIGKIKKQKNVSIIVNEKLEYERFYSIKLGLKNIGNCDFCFVQNVDNPFINKDILTYIFSENMLDACIIPHFNNKGGHPILLPKMLINQIKNIKQNKINFKTVLKKYKIYNLDIPKSEILININLPKEYDFYFKKN